MRPTIPVHGEQAGRFSHGFCRWKLWRWCDRHDVDYIVGVAKNDRLNALTAGACQLE